MTTTIKQLAPNVEVVVCGDRENDSDEVFQEWNQRRADGGGAAEGLIRCSQKRAIKLETKEKEGEGLFSQKINSGSVKVVTAALELISNKYMLTQAFKIFPKSIKKQLLTHK